MYYYNQELYHHGIKGQRWGIRRFQNKDGSLTAAGRKRYDEDEDEDNVEYKYNKAGESGWTGAKRAIQEKLSLTDKQKKYIKTGAAVAGAAAVAAVSVMASRKIKDTASTKYYEAGKAVVNKYADKAADAMMDGNMEKAYKFYGARFTRTREELQNNRDAMKKSLKKSVKYLANPTKYGYKDPYDKDWVFKY